MKTLFVVVAIIGACAAQRAAKTTYGLPSGSFSYVNQFDNVQVRPDVGYVQPVAKYVQPVAKYVQPVTKYVQPIVRAQDAVVRPFAPPVGILSMSSDSTFDGNFKYDFASENGIQSIASGSVKPVAGSESPAQVISGSYSYTSPDGTPVVTNWYADETGFHAEGSHLPVAPPVPEEIQRSLEYLRSLPPNPEDHKWD